MATKREVEERLRKCRAEVAECRTRILELEAGLEHAKDARLTPEVARQVLGESDDHLVALLKKASELNDCDTIRFHLRGIMAHIEGKTLAEFLQTES